MVTKNKIKASTPLHPYFIAIVTAVLAGLFSIIGNYFAAQYQLTNITKQQQIQSRFDIYRYFLESLNTSPSNELSALLYIGGIARHAATDYEIQNVEDRFQQLIYSHSISEIYEYINNKLNVLLAFASPDVKNYCKDIIMLLSTNDAASITWSKYPQSIQDYFYRWKLNTREGQAYGWESKITDDERLSIIMTSALFSGLLDEINKELFEHTIK